jgi:hypothetical protein
MPYILSVEELKLDAENFAKSGDIDALSGLAGDDVYLFSGSKDTVVHTGVVMKTGEFYQAFKANVTGIFTYAAEHCQPTVNYGNDCAKLGSPYISKCAYDGAGAALSAILGRALNPKGAANLENLSKIDQTKFFPSGGAKGLNDYAYLYVPSSCKSGATCSIHIDFHGCNQEPSKLGSIWPVHGGYLEWAETNNLIVLFPQARTVLGSNPEGCFDWWGYSSKNYAFKSGPQMVTFMNMAKSLGFSH